MHTPTHMLMGAAAFGRGRAGPAMGGALGGLAPDVPSFALVLWAAAIEHRGAKEIFDQLYFSVGWQAIMAPSHSIPLWLLAFAVAVGSRSGIAVAFAASGLLHQAFDMAFHAEDAHRHLWPISTWRFISPVSYWDDDQYGDVVAPFEVVLGLSLAVWLARKHRSRWARTGLALLAATYLAQLAAVFLLFGD